MTMRIGLNATGFNDRPSGARQRFVGIYGALIRERRDWTFLIYEPADCRVADWFDGAPNVIARATPFASQGRLQRVARNFTYWGGAFTADHLDLFENFVLPLVAHPTAPTVLTIHDIRPLYEPGNPVVRRLRAQVLRQAFSRADSIITVSDAVRAEILAFHPQAAVSTVYNGVETSAFTPPAADIVDAVRNRYRLPQHYVLAIGHLERRKNLALLIDAVAALRDAGRERPLVIVGNDGGEGQELRARIAWRQLGDIVTMIEHADDSAVRALYAACEMLAFPSRYEGFGIPILEAMAADRPMVLADTEVFRELTRDQARYFPVDDVAAAVAAIDLVWRDPVERARQSVFAAGRVNDFTFDHLARQIAAIYQSLVPAPR